MKPKLVEFYIHDAEKRRRLVLAFRYGRKRDEVQEYHMAFDKDEGPDRTALKLRALARMIEERFGIGVPGSVEEVIGRYVKLKPDNDGGVVACCPFHPDKEWSLIVGAGKWACSECGAAGDAAEWIRAYEDNE